MKHIPNLLSGFRLVLIPFFVWQACAGNAAAAGIILLVSSVTDFFDGMLARRFNWISGLGKILDPIADKFTQITVSFVLMRALREYWYFFAFIIVKDFFILLLGFILLKRGMHYKGSKMMGKISTFFFYGGTVAMVFFPAMPRLLILGILITAFLLALVSGLFYVPEYFRYRKETEKKS